VALLLARYEGQDGSSLLIFFERAFRSAFLPGPFDLPISSFYRVVFRSWRLVCNERLRDAKDSGSSVDTAVRQSRAAPRDREQRGLAHLGQNVIHKDDRRAMVRDPRRRTCPGVPSGILGRFAPYLRSQFRGRVQARSGGPESSCRSPRRPGCAANAGQVNYPRQGPRWTGMTQPSQGVGAATRSTVNCVAFGYIQTLLTKQARRGEARNHRGRLPQVPGRRGRRCCVAAHEPRRPARPRRAAREAAAAISSSAPRTLLRQRPDARRHRRRLALCPPCRGRFHASAAWWTCTTVVLGPVGRPALVGPRGPNVIKVEPPDATNPRDRLVLCGIPPLGRSTSR